MSAFTLQTLSAMTLSDAQTQLFSSQVSMHQQLIIRSGVKTSLVLVFTWNARRDSPYQLGIFRRSGHRPR
jgi:hypothetical protein